MSCGIGAQKRLRRCNNPLPANGGRRCVGSDAETRSCQGKPCPGEDSTAARVHKRVCKRQQGLHLCLFTVDGNWSEWSVWEECSRTCGQGNRTRVRTCTDPPARDGGRLCEGKAVEVIMCSVRPCPGKQEQNVNAWGILPIVSHTNIVVILVQWLVTGGLGYRGVPALRPVGRACSPECGCATTLPQHLMGHIVKAQTHKHKCAKRDPVQVRRLGWFFK